MSIKDTRLADTLESHPRLTGALFTSLLLLTYGVSAAVAGSAGSSGP